MYTSTEKNGTKHQGDKHLNVVSLSVCMFVKTLLLSLLRSRFHRDNATPLIRYVCNDYVLNPYTYNNDVLYMKLVIYLPSACVSTLSNRMRVHAYVKFYPVKIAL